MLRLSRRQLAGLAVALAFLLWMPQGISTQNHTIVTGHSTFFNGTVYDQCMASIAGILRSRVMWFNDMVLAERYAGKGTFLYVTENGSEDPTTKRALYTEGVFYDFVDPNGAHWHVDEAFYYEDLLQYKAEGRVPDPVNSDVGNVDTDGLARVQTTTNKTYVWIVELAAAPIHDQFAGTDPRYAHDIYNFLVMVDTCKMRKMTSDGGKINDAKEVHDTPDELSTERGHAAGVGSLPHEHETYLANIWIGKRPNLVPMGASESGLLWQSSWATGYATDTDARADQTETRAETTQGGATQTRDSAAGRVEEEAP